MERINSNYILSAFENVIDYNLIEKYANRLIIEDIYHECPPIQGFYRIIDEDDIGQKFIRDFEECEDPYVGPQHIGMKVWVVTDGHHRSFAFRRAYERTRLHIFLWMDAEFDKSCFVTKSEIENNTQIL